MKCNKCDTRMKVTEGNHPYEAAGLPTVVLKGVKVHHCEKCKVNEVEIPKLEPLHIRIAAELVLKPTRLTGPEVAVLRKFIALEPEQYAKMAELHSTTLERWEAGRMKVAWTHELNMRLAAMAALGDEIDADPKPLTHFTMLGLVNRAAAVAPMKLAFRYSRNQWECTSSPL